MTSLVNDIVHMTALLSLPLKRRQKQWSGVGWGEEEVTKS